MVSQSWDGKRVYVTSSLLANWDKKAENDEQKLRAFSWDGKALEPLFEVDFTEQKLGRAHHMKFGTNAIEAAYDPLDATLAWSIATTGYTMKSATRTGSTPSSRKSFIRNSTAAPAQTPTHAMRVDVSATPMMRAGSTKAVHMRSRVSNSSFDSATPMASIRMPE